MCIQRNVHQKRVVYVSGSESIVHGSFVKTKTDVSAENVDYSPQLIKNLSDHQEKEIKKRNLS